MEQLEVGIVGLGIAGTTAALLLAADGHRVTVVERADDPSPVGAGIWLQEYGQQVLARLGLLAPLRARSRAVARISMVTTAGRPLMTLNYDLVPDRLPALGVHRGQLFDLLHDAAVAHPLITVVTGAPVVTVTRTADGTMINTEDVDHGPFELIIGADGRGSEVRRALGLTTRDREYRYGALWAVVDDPQGLARDELYQCLRGTRDYLGVLPTGLDQASIFWSVKDPEHQAIADLAAWRRRALPFAGRYAPLIDAVDHLLPASYGDVAVRTPYRTGTGGRYGHAAVLIGDAAHAMSPQLGVGASMALTDAWSLAEELRAAPDLAIALAAHARRRRHHVRWYQWCTRMMMPFFQSDLDLLAVPRDLLAPIVSGRRPLARMMVSQLLSDRTSPFTALPPPITTPPASGIA